MLIKISCELQAKHTEIEYYSTGGNPQLLLNETDSGYSRLKMQNIEKGNWTIAARTGPFSTDDDFNIYYDNGSTRFNILNFDADTPHFKIDADVNARENLYVGSDNNFSNLYLHQLECFLIQMEIHQLVF